jgi:hypothetical protein
MKSLNRKSVQHAVNLHQTRLKQAKRAAIANGWEPSFIDEIANLEWSISSLHEVAKRDRANKQQLQSLLEVHDAAKLEITGMFALSQI